MKVLMVGSGKGSFQMRAVQLGAALGARVTSTPTADDYDWATLVILVKRSPQHVVAEAHRRHLPIVWDALDFWRQPIENGGAEAHARMLLQRQIDAIQPALVVAATQAMADACGGVYLPHHSWAGLSPTPARETVQVVAYEGNTVYLGRWQGWIQAACQARGWSFVVNPPSLSAADILVSFREGQWDGWICREWKSGVKAVNAIAAGRPIISQHSASRRELQPAGTVIESQAHLSAAFDAWEPYAARQSAVVTCESLAPFYRLPAVVDAYRSRLMSMRAAWAA